MALGINSISGLFSGMDTASLVDSLIDFERRPAYILEATKARDELKLATFNALEGVLANLKGMTDGLRRPSDFRTMRAAVSNETLLSASVDTGAPQGVYSVRVNQLAQSHQIVSQGFADDEAALGNGTVSIGLAGSEVLSVELSEGNNSLRALAEAINEAGTAVSASIINTGAGDTPYQLILAGGETGATQLVTVSTDLSGGLGLDFGGVTGVTVGSQSGSSSVTSGGHYTGNADANFSFDVVTGGVVGSDEVIIDWTNDQGDSGRIVLDGSYAGEPVDVFGSLTLSFGAGDLQAGDNWTVSGSSSTIQAAQDAELEFGGTAPIVINSASNTVDDVISGVTLNLLGANPEELVTINVAHDTDALVERLENFVSEYNNTIDFFLSQFSYNQDTETGGVLLGDRTAMRMDDTIRSDVIRAVSGLSSEFSQLAQIGIGTSVGESLDADGKLSIDTDTLRSAIEDDLEGVIALLGSSGQTSDDDIVFLNAGYRAEATGGNPGYGVHVTQAATHGRYTGLSIAAPTQGSPLSITAGNKFLKFSVDGVTSSTLSIDEGSYETGEDLAAAIQAAVNGDEELGSRGITASWVDDGGGQGHIELYSKSYGGTSKVILEEVDNSLYADAGLEGGSPLTGQDVAGYFLVDGEIEEATGAGRILTGSEQDGSTQGISVQVNLTESTLASQGEDQGDVQIWSGITDRLNSTLSRMLDSVAGTLTIKQENLRDGIDDIDEQVKKIDARLEKRRERYEKEFIRMESLMAEMSAESSSFNSMLASIGTIQTSSSSGSGS